MPDRAGGNRKSIATLYKLAVSSAILLSLVLVVGIYQLGSNAVFAGAFVGAVFIYLGSRPSLKSIGWSLMAGLILALIYRILGGTFGRDSGLESISLFIGVGAFWGAGSILVMALNKVWADTSRAPLLDALIVPIFILIAGTAMHFANNASHLSYDYLLYRFDASLGLAPGVSIVTVFRGLPWIKTASLLVYTELLIFPPLFHAWAFYKGKRAKINPLHTFVIAGLGWFLVYQICPAMGPVYAFGSQFPDHLPALSAVPVQAFLSTGVNNAMPSMHVAWALLVWVAAWELGSLAVVIASGFVLFTGLATLGFGEHYLIDLIVALPLVMAIHGICTARYKLTAIGTALVVAWMVYLRTGIQLKGALNWSFVIATILAAGFMIPSFLTTKTPVQPASGTLGILSGGEQAMTSQPATD